MPVHMYRERLSRMTLQRDRYCFDYYDEGGMPLTVSRDAACRSPNENNKNAVEKRNRKLIFIGKYFFPERYRIYELVNPSFN